MEVKHKGRTQKAFRNTAFNFMFKFLDIVLSFALRTVFIHTLSVSYLGINGLFTNILTVLSLMEAGVGSAIVFSLYKPLAEGDDEKVASLMQLYKKTYNVLGVSIALIGFAMTPLLPYIINLPENVGNINVIYWLTVANTSITYFMSYRRSLLIADQRADINTKNLMVFRFTRCILLAGVLLLTHNFILYLVAEIVNSFISNIHITYVVKKRYANVEKIKPTALEEQEKKQIVKHISSGLMFKIGQTFVNSTDSILISMLINTALVGVYSNYNMIFSNLDVFVYMVFSGITASVGNFVVQKGKEELKALFNKLFLINYMIVCVITVCILCLATPFVELWIGKEFTLDSLTVLVICINFYITSLCNCSGNFLLSQGELYYKNRFRSIIEAAANLIFSVLFTAVFDMGITGIFLGTTVCYALGRLWMDPHTLYHNLFDEKFSAFIKKYLAGAVLCAILCIVCKKVTDLIFSFMSVTVISWILSGMFCALFCLFVLTLVFRKTEEYGYITDLIKKVVNKLLKR